jgi:2-methylisocitrate lyase-like PEP mutase family enzyme
MRPVEETIRPEAEQQRQWQRKALRLRQLHEGLDVLVLPHAWDRLSDRRFAGLPGCQALGSTSAGSAAALGYPDGEQAPLDALLAIIRQITAAVELPGTVDFEGGYADNPAQLAENVARVVAAGGVGIILKMGLGTVPRTGSCAIPPIKLNGSLRHVRHSKLLRCKGC